MGKNFGWRNDECPDDAERLAREEMDDSHLQPLSTPSEREATEFCEEDLQESLPNEDVEVEQILEESDSKSLHHPLDLEDEESEDEQEKENEDLEE